MWYLFNEKHDYKNHVVIRNPVHKPPVMENRGEKIFGMADCSPVVTSSCERGS